MSYIPNHFPAPAPLPMYGPGIPMSSMTPLGGGIASLGNQGATGVLGRASTILPQAAQYIPQHMAGTAGASGLTSAAESVVARLAGSAATAAMPSELGFASQLGRAVGGGRGLTGVLGSTSPLLPKGAMLRGGLYGLAGGIGSGLADRYTPGSHNSNLEQGLQGAAQGAGIGAGLGLLGGPLAALSSPAGAAIGGVVGGAIGVLGNTFGWGGGSGDKEEEIVPEKVIANAMAAAQLDAETSEQIMVYYDTQMAFAQRYEDDAQREQAEAAALESVGQLVLQAVGTREQSSMDAGNVLALQSQARDIFEPIAQSSIDSANLYAQEMRGLTGSLPPQYAGLLEKQASDATYGGAKLADAYRAQAAVAPMINALTQYQRDNNAYAAQMFQQSMAQNGAQQGPTTNDVMTALQNP